MKFIIIIYTTNKLTVVEMEDIRGVRLRKFNLRKIIFGVRMHFRHTRWMIFGKNHTTNNFIPNKRYCVLRKHAGQKKQETEIHSANTKQRIGPQ